MPTRTTDECGLKIKRIEDFLFFFFFFVRRFFRRRLTNLWIDEQNDETRKQRKNVFRPQPSFGVNGSRGVSIVLRADLPEIEYVFPNDRVVAHSFCIEYEFQL